MRPWRDLRKSLRSPSNAEVDEAHNWCDRWCERCPLADRCSIGRSARVESPQAALVGVAVALERAIEMLHVEFAKHGLEPSTSEPPPIVGGIDDLAERAVRWARASATWLKTAPAGEDSAVVDWYHTLVPTKLYRASSSRASGNDDNASGRAKVASLGIAAVVHALTSHCQRAPADGAGLELLVETHALMEAVESGFPRHMSFRRPAFDP